MEYISTNIEKTVAIAIPGSSSGDTVSFAVYKVSDASTFASGSMTYIGGIQWKMSFTPDADDVYALEVNDETLDVKHSRDFKSTSADIIIYDSIDEEFTAVIAIPESQSTDTVTYTVYKASDSSVFDSGSAEYVAGLQWKVAFTPDEEDTYIVQVTNSTLDVIWSKSYYFNDGTLFPDTPLVSPGNLTTLANLKSVLRQDVTTDDTLLKAIITRISQAIAKLCNRTFYARDIVEYHDGDGTDRIISKQYPVNSISSIYDDVDRAYTSDTLIDSTDYVFYSDNGRICLDGLVFDVGLKNVKLSYNAGYSYVPQELEQACIKMCIAEYLESVGAINAIEAQDFVYKPKKLRDDAQLILDKYRDWVR
jgi:hypothetical protein